MDAETRRYLEDIKSEMNRKFDVVFKELKNDQKERKEAEEKLEQRLVGADGTTGIYPRLQKVESKLTILQMVFGGLGALVVTSLSGFWVIFKKDG